MDANFCPTCAQPLNRLDWSEPQERVRYLSCGAHYFELVDRGYDCALKQLKLKACTDCGSLIPYLKDRHGLCQECLFWQRQAWRMDSEQSFALLEITPFVSASGSHFRCQTSITIRPYPNPAAFGGLYGSDYPETEEALEKIIAGFNKQADGFRQYGMTKVEIKRNEPVLVASQCRLDTSPQVEEEDQPSQSDFTEGEVVKFQELPPNPPVTDRIRELEAEVQKLKDRMTLEKSRKTLAL